MDPILTVVLALLLCAVFALIYLVASRYKTVPPNKALVIYRKGKPPADCTILTSGGAIVWPWFMKYEWLDLSSTTLRINVYTVILNDGTIINLNGLAEVRIAVDQASLKKIVHQMLTQTKKALDYIVQKTIEGNVRKVCAMTVTAPDELHNRQGPVIRRIENSLRPELSEMGLEIVSFKITEIEELEPLEYSPGKPKACFLCGMDFDDEEHDMESGQVGKTGE